MIRRQGSNPFIGVLVILLLFVMIWMAISAVRGVFMILSWLALPLFVLALILNYSVVTDYFKWLWKMLREDTVKGLIYSGLSIVAYPVVSAYLAFKAFTNNRWTNPKAGGNKSKGDYIDYKEVEITDEEDFLELPELDVMKKDSKNADNKYDDMF